MALQAQLPHNYHAIVENADSELDMSCVNKLYDQLHTGVFLNKKTRRYSVDKESCANSFELFARDLTFCGGDWKWDEEGDIEVAELVNGQRIEVKGELNSNVLTPGKLYEAAFVLKMKENAHGWKYPVNLKVQLPNGTHIRKQENLTALVTEKWIKIPIGKFPVSKHMDGLLEISLYELSDQWKSGLVIKEVIIRPVPPKN